jgi:hypothetical protein
MDAGQQDRRLGPSNRRCVVLDGPSGTRAQAFVVVVNGVLQGQTRADRPVRQGPGGPHVFGSCSIAVGRGPLRAAAASGPSQRTLYRLTNST